MSAVETSKISDVPAPQAPGRLTWPAAAFVMAASVLIVALSTYGGALFADQFDRATEFGQPRAYRPGEPEALATARLASYLIIIQTITALLTPVAAVALVALSRERFLSWRQVLPLTFRTRELRVLVVAVVMLVLMAVMYATVIYWLAPAMLKNDVRPFANLMQTNTWWLLLLAAGVGAPIAEELLFRGFLFGGLSETRLGPIMAAVISAGIWAGLHANYSLVGLTAIFLIGLYLAWLRWRFGTLIIPIVCHSIYNTMIMLVLLSAPKSALM